MLRISARECVGASHENEINLLRFDLIYRRPAAGSIGDEAYPGKPGYEMLSHVSSSALGKQR
jgi:hypothetical protein